MRRLFVVAILVVLFLSLPALAAEWKKNLKAQLEGVFVPNETVLALPSDHMGSTGRMMPLRSYRNGNPVKSFGPSDVPDKDKEPMAAGTKVIITECQIEDTRVVILLQGVTPLMVKGKPKALKTALGFEINDLAFLAVKDFAKIRQQIEMVLTPAVITSAQVK